MPDFPELALNLELSGGDPLRLCVDADCAYVPTGVGRRLRYLRPSRADLKRNRLFFKLVYFIVYYPLAWYLQRTRGWGLVHASAVVLPEGRAVVLSGLGGVGKSTLGLALLETPGTRLLSDNLVFHDEERIYCCPEPVRLDDSALEGMPEGAGKPARTGLPATAHPKPTYRVPQGRAAGSAAPGTVAFLRFAPRSGETPLDAGRAAEMLRAANDLAREIKDYRPFSAVLAMIAAEAGGPPAAPQASLERLLGGARCAIFAIGRGETIPRTLDRLAGWIGSPA